MAAPISPTPSAAIAREWTKGCRGSLLQRRSIARSAGGCGLAGARVVGAIMGSALALAKSRWQSMRAGGARFRRGVHTVGDGRVELKQPPFDRPEAAVDALRFITAAA